jgi:hypothetical protein
MDPDSLEALAPTWTAETPTEFLESVWRATPEEHVMEVADLVNRVNASWYKVNTDLYTYTSVRCDNRAEQFLTPYVYAGMLLIVKEDM